MLLHAPQDFAPGHHPTPTPPAVPVHRAQDLTGGGPLAQIVLDGKVYALRITRAGKLILTK